MIKTYKVLSLLLDYPVAETQSAMPALSRAIIDEGLIAPHQRARLVKFMDNLAVADLTDLQERFVLLFDRSRSLSLHLFEHIHGESRDRGQAMVDLIAHYRCHGLTIDAKELPDYLPLFLEFISTLPMDEATSMLAEPAHVISALAERHKKRNSAYSIVFDVLATLAGNAAIQGDIDALQTVPDDDPTDLAALDKSWEEQAVMFGPGAASDCAMSQSHMNQTRSRRVHVSVPVKRHTA